MEKKKEIRLNTNLSLEEQKIKEIQSKKSSQQTHYHPSFKLDFDEDGKMSFYS